MIFSGRVKCCTLKLKKQGFGPAFFKLSLSYITISTLNKSQSQHYVPYS
jgi:hypothetical protein